MQQISPKPDYSLLPASAGGIPGVYEAMTIYVLPTPGEDCQVLTFWGAFPKGIWLRDDLGNDHFCELSPSVPLPVSEEICLPNPFISGTIYKVPPMGECIGSVNYGIPDVTVEMEILNPPPAATYSTTTFVNGSYMQEINQIAHIGKDFRVRPVYNEAFLCGVTQHDLSLIQNHLLGLQALQHHWQLIAADVNESNTVSISDVVAIRKVMLSGENTDNLKSWRFVPDHLYNPSPTAFPASYNEYRDVPNVTAPVTGQGFIGIKMGDVDGSCTNCADDPNYYLMDPQGESAEAETRTPEFVLHALFRKAPGGHTILELVSPHAQTLGTSLMLDISLENFRFAGSEYRVEVYSPRAEEGESRIVNDAIRYGYINTLHASSPIEAGTVMLRIELGEALTTIPDVVCNGESWRNAQIVDGREHAIRIETVQEVQTATATDLMAWPNPASDIAYIRSATNQPFRILDLNGRQVMQGQLQEGLNTFSLEGLGDGLYLLQTEEAALRLMINR